MPGQAPNFAGDLRHAFAKGREQKGKDCADVWRFRPFAVSFFRDSPKSTKCRPPRLPTEKRPKPEKSPAPPPIWPLPAPRAISRRGVSTTRPKEADTQNMGTAGSILRPYDQGGRAGERVRFHMQFCSDRWSVTYTCIYTDLKTAIHTPTHTLSVMTKTCCPPIPAQTLHAAIALMMLSKRPWDPDTLVAPGANVPVRRSKRIAAQRRKTRRHHCKDRRRRRRDNCQGRTLRH